MTENQFSVLMAVYGAERPAYLEAALKSVWDKQTLKPDQIVLVKDGPLTAELEATVSAWQAKLGEVLDVVALDTNRGLATALNAGLPVCKHDLVARMDSNDLSLPERFARQVALMAANPDIAVCSGQMEEWNETMDTQIGLRRVPESHEEIFRMAHSRNPMNHTTTMYRKSAVLGVGGYPIIYPEDYPLWCLMLMRGHRFANLPVATSRMRADNNFLARRGRPILEGEMQILDLQRRIGMLNRVAYARNVAVRQILRRSPNWFRKTLYRYARH